MYVEKEGFRQRCGLRRGEADSIPEIIALSSNFHSSLLITRSFLFITFFQHRLIKKMRGFLEYSRFPCIRNRKN